MQTCEISRHFISLLTHYLQLLYSAAVLNFFWIVFYFACQSSAFLQTAQEDSVSPPLPSPQMTWFLGSRTWSHLFSCTSNSCLAHCHNSMTFISASAPQSHIQVTFMFLSFVSLPPHWGFFLHSDIPKKAHYQNKSQLSCGSCHCPTSQGIFLAL